MSDDIFIKHGLGAFQQPYIGRASVNAQEPIISQRDARQPADARQPGTYQHRTPGTYRLPASARTPFIRNAQTPNIRSQQEPTIKDAREPLIIKYDRWRCFYSSTLEFSHHHLSSSVDSP